ncbi:MAG TPA: TIGR03756 family integrating conjugative element protein [Gammaproteobacteria bacterium]|jgi:integrating conjugative element protein (TIGR03756 family)|nr:TIGR03756 family integrating conjugative element protein [Gammaproteobacteria bacterium]
MLKQKRKKLFIIFLGIGINLIFANASIALTTPSIIQSTLQALPDCLQHRIIGMCYWLKCGKLGCHVTTTLKVDHYLPDAVVTVYQKYQSNPWDYANKVIDTPAYQLGNTQFKTQTNIDLGHGNQSTSVPTEQNTHFKEVDVVGHPAAVGILQKLNPLLMPSVAKPFFPYYVSLADAYMWRSPAIEAMRYPQNLIPGVRVVGSLLNNWGSVYPRTGFLVQPNDAKAAAVIAQRAVDIAAQANQSHIYTVLTSGSCGEDCKISEIKENNKDTQWQMIYPIVDKSCRSFGANDLTQFLPWGTEAANKGSGNYVWVLWRRYQGCISANGKYLGSVG